MEGDSGGQVQGVYVTRQEESQGSCGDKKKFPIFVTRFNKGRGHVFNIEPDTNIL